MWTPPEAPGPEHQLLFVGGLHRSGTTPLARALAEHPDASGFSGTGVEEDEGQHLQDVYPAAYALGGPGRFARKPASHLTEESALATPDSAARLWTSWKPFWNLDKRILIEKSPSNLVMTRFLQALFPDAAFLMIVRHPVVVTLSTAKWAPRTPLPLVMDNWFVAHDRLRADLPHLSRAKVITYEALTRRPAETVAGVGDFLGLSTAVPHESLRGDRSSVYEQQW
ncbi:MAG TPA: sulfotransferase, partial [Pedococcus sp.]|nr:sulfotransferase [Pedococcus sp.]